MYAIVEVGAKQYKVAKGDQILVDKAVGPRTRKLSIEKVLLAVKDKKAGGERSQTIKIGNPYLKEAKVNCEIIEQRKGKKTIAFKFRRRKNSQWKKGHRQKLVLVKVTEISIK